jgi:DNA-binding MarR family transcriptional regulator
VAKRPSPEEVEVEEAFQSLHEFLMRLLSAMDVDTMDDIIDTELGFSHFKALLILGRHCRPLSVNELSDELRLSLAATGRAVDKLVGLDMVTRREDEFDRRIKRVALAEAGEKAVAIAVHRRHDSIRNLVTALPGDLRANLNNALLPVLAGDFLAPSPCADDQASM